jgi:hypothetical protein
MNEIMGADAGGQSLVVISGEREDHQGRVKRGGLEPVFILRATLEFLALIHDHTVMLAQRFGDVDGLGGGVVMDQVGSVGEVNREGVNDLVSAFSRGMPVVLMVKPCGIPKGAVAVPVGPRRKCDGQAVQFVAAVCECDELEVADGDGSMVGNGPQLFPEDIFKFRPIGQADFLHGVFARMQALHHRKFERLFQALVASTGRVARAHPSALTLSRLAS